MSPGDDRHTVGARRLAGLGPHPATLAAVAGGRTRAASPVASLVVTLVADGQPAPARVPGRISEREMLDRLLEHVRGGESAAWSSGERPASGRRRCSGMPLARRPASGRPGRRRRVRDGVAVRWPAPALRADARPARRPSGSSAGRPERRLRPVHRRRSRPLPGCPRHPRPAGADRRRSGRCSASSTTPSGSTARRARSSASSPDGWWPSRGLVFAVRELTERATRSRACRSSPLGGLPEEDARALLATVVPGRLDDHVRDRIVAETRGNPLALLELPGRDRRRARRRLRHPGAGRSSGQIEDRYLRRLGRCRRRHAAHAARSGRPVGDASLVWRAAQDLASSSEAAAPAESERCWRSARGPLPHPLVRSAVYRCVFRARCRAATARWRRRPTPRRSRPPAGTRPLRRRTRRGGRRRARALAGRAQARGGLAAAAAFLRRRRTPTPDPAAAAADAGGSAGRPATGVFDAALGLLAAAESGALDDLERARVDLLRGRVASASGAASEAPPAAEGGQRLEPLDVDGARRPISTRGVPRSSRAVSPARGTLLKVSRSRQGRPAGSAPESSDLLLDGLAALMTDGGDEAASVLGGRS